MPHVTHLDHLVLTVSDIGKSVEFYQHALGMSTERFTATDGSIRTALRFGVQKINLHEADQSFKPHALKPQPGSADLCFISETGIDDWQTHFAASSIPILEGPVTRSGANGSIVSLYIRDPDGNLLEISVYD